MTRSLSLAAALGAALAAPALAQTHTGQEAPKPAFSYEKCYGVAKARQNDCQTARSSCAGTSVRDRQSDAWIYTPVGTCERIVGGVPKRRKGA